MKKLLLAIFSICIALQGFSQRGIEVGGFASVQSVWIFNADDFEAGEELNFRATMGAAYGGNLGFNFSDHVGIRTGLFISTQGQQYITGDDFIFPNFKSKARMSYTKIPVLFKYNGFLDAPVSFLLNIGVDFGFLGTAKYSSEPYGIVPSIDNLDVKDNYNNMDIAGVLAFGGQSNLAENLNLNFLFRFSYSLLDIEDPDDKAFGRSSANHLSAGFLLGLNYVIGL